MSQEEHYQSTVIHQTGTNNSCTVGNVINIHMQNFNAYHLSDNPYYQSGDITPEILKTLIPILEDYWRYTINIQSNRGTVTLDVHHTDTILSIKLKLQLIHGIPFTEQYLEFDGKILQNNYTLEDYDVIKNTRIRLAYSTIKTGKAVIIQRIHGRLLCIKVDHNIKVKDLKVIIEEEEGLPVEKQCLFFDNGVTLKDETHMADYEVENEIIQLAAKEDRKKLYVLLENGKKIPIVIGLYETISDLKDKVQSDVKIQFKNQCLSYRGNVLENNRTLSSYLISDNSTLNITTETDVVDSPDINAQRFSYVKRCAEMQNKKLIANCKKINIRTSIGEVICIIPHSLEILIGDIKQEIERKRGFLVKHQTIFLMDKELSDESKPLHHYYNSKCIWRISEVTLELLLK